MNLDTIFEQAQQIQTKYYSNRKALNAAKIRIKELEGLLLQSSEEIKTVKAEKDNLKSTVECLENFLKDLNAENSQPNSPSACITDDLSSQTSNDANSANSPKPNDNAVLSADDETPKEIPTAVRSDDDVIRRDVGIQTDIDIHSSIPEENNEKVETTSHLVGNDKETASGTNDISNYFSTFYVDPQNTVSVAGEGNIVTSLIPPSLRMVLSSFDCFDKRYVVFFANDDFGKPECCEFLSIDDLLASPQNEDLRQMLRETYDPLQNESNVPILTVIGELIARNYFPVPNFANNYNVNTVHEENENVQQDQPIEQQDPTPVEYECKRAPAKAPVKRRGGSLGKRPSIKRSVSYKWELDESDSDGAFSGKSSTSDEWLPENEKNYKTKCRACEINDHKIQYFKSYRALDAHLLKKHPFTSFPTYHRCPYGGDECKRHYLNQKDLLRHVKAKHSNANTHILENSVGKIKSQECPYCAETFSSCRIFKKHMTEHHPGSAETAKVVQTPELLGHVTQVKTEAESETPKQAIREKKEKKTKKTPLSKKPSHTVEKLCIRRKKGKLTVSKRRKTSVSSDDDEFDPDAVSIPDRADKSASRRRTRTPNVIVTSAEIHQTETVITQTEEISEPANSTAVTKEIAKSANSSGATDINEFVLTSINEISSIVNKHYAETPEPYVQNNSSTSQQPSSFIMPSSLPCLLDNCTGCDYHPKPTFISFTLDDEYVSSCRDEILADLYSIPSDPLMTSNSYSAALSSPSRYDCVQTDYTCNDTDKGEAEDVVDAASSNRINDQDGADVIVADNPSGPEKTNADTDNVPNEGDNTTSTSVLVGEEHRSEAEIQPLKIDANDRVIRDVEPNNSIDPPSVDEDRPEMSENENAPTETSVSPKPNETANVDDQNNLDDNRAREAPLSFSELDDNHCSSSSNIEVGIRDGGISPNQEPPTNLDTSPLDNGQSEINETTSIETTVSQKCNETTDVDDQNNHVDNQTRDVPLPSINQVSVMELDNREADERCSKNSNIELIVREPENSDPRDAPLSSVNQILSMEVDNAEPDDDHCSRSSNIELVLRDDEIATNQEPFDRPDTLPLNKGHPEIGETALIETTVSQKQNETANGNDQNNLDDNQTCEEPLPSINQVSVMELDNREADERCSKNSNIELIVREPENSDPRDAPLSSVNQILSMEVDNAEPDDDHCSRSSNIELVLRDDEIATNQEPFDRPDTLPLNKGHPEIGETALIETTVSQKQNETANVNDQNNLDDNQTCEEPLPSINPLPTMEVDDEHRSDNSNIELIAPESENDNSTPITTRNEVEIAKSYDGIQIPNNLVLSSDDETSDTNEDHLETNDTVPTSAENTHQKSIFDPDDESNLEPPQQSCISSNSNSSTDDVASKARVNETSQTSTAVSSCMVSETTPTEASSSTETNNADIAPKSPTATTSTEIPESASDVTSSNRENDETSAENIPLDLSASKGSSTFYDEFDLVNVCEVETCDGEESNTSTPPCAEKNQPMKNDQVALDAPVLKQLLAQAVACRSTNEIIEGVGIEIEISDYVSPPQCSAYEHDSVAVPSPPRQEIDNIEEKSERTDAEAVIKSSSVRKKLNYSTDKENPEFESLVKQMLTDKSLGVVKTADEPTSVRSPSSCSSCSCSNESHSGDSSNDSEEEENEQPATDAVRTVEADTVPTVESEPGPPHLLPMQTDETNEKEGYEANIKSADISPPVLSPNQPQPVHMSPHSTTQSQTDPNLCSVLNITSTSFPYQPDQSHNAIEINARRPEGTEGSSSPLITSSGQLNEPDPLPNAGTRNDTHAKSDLEIISMYRAKRDINLINIRIILPRIGSNSISNQSQYSLRRQKRVSYALLNGMKLKRVFSCNICPTVFLRGNSLSKHVNSMHNGSKGTFKCSVCGFVALNKGSLSAHRKHRHLLLSTDFMECLICEYNNEGGTVYDCNEALNSHIISEHPDPSPFYIRCPYREGECYWHSLNMLELSEHVDIYHKKEALIMQWQCSLCEKIFPRDDLLSSHISLVHSHLDGTSVSGIRLGPVLD